MAARCETVLNTTMAEMDTYHTQKLEDFQELAKEHLDGEIALYEQVSHSLRTWRRDHRSACGTSHNAQHESVTAIQDGFRMVVSFRPSRSAPVHCIIPILHPY